MGEPTDLATPRRSGLHRMVSGYLGLRSAPALATDAVVLMLGAVIVNHLWSAIYEASDATLRGRPADSILAAIVDPVALARSVYSALTVLAWMLFAWAGVRLLAGRLPGAPRQGD